MAKSKYESHVAPYLDRIAEWVEAGATAKEVAQKLRVAYSSFKKYLKEYSDLKDAYARACEEPDDKVEAALYRSCTGYNAQVVKHYKIKRVEYDPETGKRLREVEELVAATDEVHVAGSPAAQFFWLSNRRPEKWKYKPAADQEGREDGETGVILMPTEGDGSTLSVAAEDGASSPSTGSHGPAGREGET